MNHLTQAAFLFDLDGVIIDSESVYTEIWNKINDTFPTGHPDFARAIKGTTLENILSTFYPDAEIRQKVEKMLYEEEGRIAYRPVPGAIELLEKLKKNGIPAALVTSSNGVKMKHLEEQMPELIPAFSVIITGDDVKHSKPDPEGYLSAGYRLDVMPMHCAVVEDSVQGVKAGRNAGCYVIGLAGTMPEAELAPYCDLVVHRLEDINVEETVDILKGRG